ncbi:unnamed protein product, partial [Candidula unifasciata]
SARSVKTEVKGTLNGDGEFGDSRVNGGALQHNDAVASVAAVRPGLCLSGSKDQSIVLYDYITRKQLERWTGHTDSITKVWYGSRCSGVFSASRDKTVKLWRAGNPHWVQEYAGHSLVVTAIHLNSDNTQLCSGSRDNSVKLWDVETAKCIKTNTIPQNLVTDVKFVPCSSWIVQTGEDKEVRVLDSRTLEPIFSFPKKQYIQTCCDVSPDGNYVISASNGFTGNGCEGSLWDMRTRKLQLEYRGHHEAVESCLFLPGTQTEALLASASRDCSVKVWSQDTGVCECEYVVDGAGPLTSLAAYPDGTILVGSFKCGVQVLKFSNKTLSPVFNF